MRRRQLICPFVGFMRRLAQLAGLLPTDASSAPCERSHGGGCELSPPPPSFLRSLRILLIAIGGCFKSSLRTATRYDSVSCKSGLTVQSLQPHAAGSAC